MFNKTNSPASSSTPTSAPSAARSAPARSAPTRSASVPSILGRDIAITGDIKTDGDVQIDGRIDGNIKAGSLTIGEQGAVNGKVIANIVHVRGKVTGKIEANKVDLAETANVQADIVQDQLTIANGAFFDGKCSRKTTAPTSIKSKSKPTVKSA